MVAMLSWLNILPSYAQIVKMKPCLQRGTVKTALLPPDSKGSAKLARRGDLGVNTCSMQNLTTVMFRDDRLSRERCPYHHSSLDDKRRASLTQRWQTKTSPCSYQCGIRIEDSATKKRRYLLAFVLICISSKAKVGTSQQHRFQGGPRGSPADALDVRQGISRTDDEQGQQFQ